MSRPRIQIDLFGLPISPERLRRAREMRGLTQMDLARAAEIDQSHVACLETGTRYPSSVVLSSLARVLDLPSAYFTQPVRAYLTGGSLRYRAKADLGKRAANRIRSEAEHVLEIVFSLAEKVNLVPLRLRSTAEPPSDSAQRFRSQLRLTADSPVHHLIRNFEKLGGIVIALGAEESFDAFAEWGGRVREFPIIALADGASPDRLRMNVAHEIGHLILHRDVVVPDRQAEIEAFSFASNLLMPAQAIGRDLQATEFDLGALVEVKRKWGVSVQALVRRGRDLSLITERHYRTLNARITRLGWKYEEPGSADGFAERPLAVRRMAETAFGIPLPFPKMEKALHVPEPQLRRFFSRYGTTSEGNGIDETRSVSRRIH